MASPLPREWKERLLFRSGEVLLCGAAVFVLISVVASSWKGGTMARREARLVKQMKGIHDAEARAMEQGQHFRFLSELPEIGREALFRDFEPAKVPKRDQAPNAPTVELYTAQDYYFAVYLADPAKGDERAWSRANAGDPEVGTKGYGVFAWPRRYREETQWAYFLDHRGRLLGSWNLNQLLDGTNEPFPPTSHPLRDFMTAQKSGDDCPWIEFDKFTDIPVPEPASKPKSGK